MDYTTEKLRAMAENWDDAAKVQGDLRRTESQSNAKQLRAHAAKIEECERYRKALIHQRNALQIVRDRQHGNVSIDDLNKGIALIDAALKGEPT